MDKLATLNKQYLLIAGTFVLLIIGYELAFKNTLDLWQTHQKLQEQLAEVNDISTEPGYIYRKNKNLDLIIQSYRLDSVKFRNNVVNKIAEIAESLKVNLITIPSDEMLYHTPKFIIQKLDFEGDFFSLLKLVNKIQSTAAIGIVRSMSLKTKRMPIDNNRNSQKLNLEVYMEMSR